jgi:hypothetical protein
MCDLKLSLKTYNVYLHVTLGLSVETAARNAPHRPFHEHLPRLMFTGYLSCLTPCASLWSARPLLKQECLYKQSACDKHYACFSFSADDKMTLCLQGILRESGTNNVPPRCTLHFDMHCAARKENTRGDSCDKQTLTNFCKQ